MHHLITSMYSILQVNVITYCIITAQNFFPCYMCVSVCVCVCVYVSLSVLSNSLYPMNWDSSGFSAHGILQARILEWVAISFSRGSSWPKYQTCISCIGRQILYHWAIRELHLFIFYFYNKCLLLVDTKFNVNVTSMQSFRVPGFLLLAALPHLFPQGHLFSWYLY